MLHGKNKYIAMLIVSVLSVLSFLLIEEAGRVVYMKFYTPTSRGRELYYAIWLFSMYLAPFCIVLSCILNLRLIWNAVFAACFSSLVFYVFGNNPLWAALLLMSYFAALFVAILLKAAIIKISVFYKKYT
ncbi:hypothetical protein OB959_20200 [Aeromonas bestiarum]|uniref:Uncharacterized protein n=1 Tax=Aeromonas bestiarum TaxID=105751 RepID=A0AAW7I1I4_9GAMM|nr:hypothetical protein [Aeromonas bestiarum]MDM5142089.1 hypothetical protein [Aeromonas bestiarum]